MSKQSVSEIIDSWETHGLQNLHEINLDRIYAFPLTRNDLDIRESSIQWTLDHYEISRQQLVETKNEQVKSILYSESLNIRRIG
jgi:hypothetical protein